MCEVRGERVEAEQKVQIEAEAERQDCLRFEVRGLRGEVEVKAEG